MISLPMMAVIGLMYAIFGVMPIHLMMIAYGANKRNKLIATKTSVIAWSTLWPIVYVTLLLAIGHEWVSDREVWRES